MFKSTLLLCGCAVWVVAQVSNPVQELVESARAGSPVFVELVKKEMPKGGVQVWGQDFLFVNASDQPVTISIDEQPAVAMSAIPGTNLWYLLTKMRVGVTHSHQSFSGGKALGNRGDITGYNPDSYPKLGVPRGLLSEKQTLVLRFARSGPGDTCAVDGLAGRAGADRSRPVETSLVHRDGESGGAKADSSDGVYSGGSRICR
jgi:hypothetical protein